MINLDVFVKKYYAQIKELGLTVKTEESAAIESMRRYPQDMLEDFRLAIYGVYDGAPIRGAEPGLDRGRVGGVDHQRQIDDGLHALDDLRHHGGLVHAWQTYVDVEDVRAGASAPM